MRHCFLCQRDFADETPMVMARGSNICIPCADTPRGKIAQQRPDGEGYYPGSHVKGERFRRAVAAWSRKPLPPR